MICVLLDNFVQAVRAEKQKAIEKDEKARQAAQLLLRRAGDRGSQENAGLPKAQSSQRAPALESPLAPLIDSLAKFRDSVRPSPRAVGHCRRSERLSA